MCGYLSGLSVALGHRDDHHLRALAEVEQRRADQVADVLDEHQRAGAADPARQARARTMSASRWQPAPVLICTTRRAGAPDALGVERGLLVALDHRHAAAAPARGSCARSSVVLPAPGELIRLNADDAALRPARPGCVPPAGRSWRARPVSMSRPARDAGSCRGRAVRGRAVDSLPRPRRTRRFCTRARRPAIRRRGRLGEHHGGERELAAGHDLDVRAAAAAQQVRSASTKAAPQVGSAPRPSGWSISRAAPSSGVPRGQLEAEAHRVGTTPASRPTRTPHGRHARRRRPAR